MMSLSSLLEDFAQEAAQPVADLTEVGLEEQKLESFEKGYQAGWEDSTRAQEDSGTHISEDFARNIRDLSFTYEEAQAGVLAAMEPVVQEMVNAVLPAVAHDTLGPRIVEMLQAALAEHGRQPVLLTVAPGSASALRTILPEDIDLPLEIEETPTLAEGQVQLRFGETEESEIDLTRLLEGIRAASDSFFREMHDTTNRETA